MTHLDLRMRQALQARLMRRRLFGGVSECAGWSCVCADIVPEPELLGAALQDRGGLGKDEKPGFEGSDGFFGGRRKWGTCPGSFPGKAGSLPAADKGPNSRYPVVVDPSSGRPSPGRTEYPRDKAAIRLTNCITVVILTRYLKKDIKKVIS